MEQEQLFNETLAEALSDLVNQLGGAKRVGAAIWPEKTMEAARSMLLDALNQSHPQKLSLDQVDLILRLAHEKGIHTIAEYISRRFGYKFIPVKPEDERAELQREIVNSVGRLETIIKRLSELEGKPLLISRRQAG